MKTVLFQSPFLFSFDAILHQKSGYLTKMKNELSILNALAGVIQHQLSGYLAENLESISKRNVTIDFPDTDQMPMKTMFYIQPNWAD